MIFAFYVVDEAAMPPESARGGEEATPAALAKTIGEHGGAWGQVAVEINDFTAVFETLDRFIEVQDFLPKLAFAGSPRLLLTGQPGSWRMGYFDASLVVDLLPVFNARHDEIEAAMQSLGEAAEETYAAFYDAVEEAEARGFAVAILHEW